MAAFPTKCQVCLDDNGEPAGLPALKTMKSVENNSPWKKLTVRMIPENINPTPAPLKKNFSVASDI